MKSKDIPLVIFAGGKSKRMGQNKALLPFASSPTLTQFQLERFENHFKKVYISCKDRDIFDFKAYFIEDFYKDISSPIVALFSVLKSLDEDIVAILSVDTPFVSKEVYEKLLSFIDEYEAIIPDYHPLCGVYKRDILPVLEKMIKENRHSLKEFFEKIDVKKVKFSDEKEFENLNFFHEYEEALKKL